MNFDDLIPKQKPLTFDDLIPAPATSVPADVAKAAGSGLARGVIGLATLPGDLQNMARSGVGWALDQTLGRAVNRATQGTWEAPDAMRSAARELNDQNPATADRVERAISGVTGPFYDAQTTPGKFAGTIARNVPGALLGPGGVIPKAAMAIVPGVAEETAGLATQGTAGEPYARAGASIVAGLGTIAGARALERSAMRNEIVRSAPSRDDLERAADALYKQADQMGIQYSPNEFRRFVERQTADLANAGIDPVLNPRSTRALNRLQETAGIPPVTGTIQAAQMQANMTPAQLAAPYANQPIAPTLGDIEKLRRTARMAGTTLDQDDRRLAGNIVRGIDEFIENPGIIGSGSATADQASQLMKDARANWGAMRRSEIVDEAIRRAELRTMSTGSGGNIDNALRQQLRVIVEKPKLSRGFSSEELGMLEAASRGSPTQNALRLVGKLSPSGSGLMTALGLGAAAANPAAALPIAGGMAGSVVAKRLSDGMTRKNAELVAAMTRARSPAASPELQALIASNPQSRIDRAAVLRALLLSRQPVNEPQ